MLVIYLYINVRRRRKLEKPFGTVLEKFLTCRARESRSKARWYGLHIRLHLTWAQRSTVPRSALAYNESECVRLISISGIVSKRHLISDGIPTTMSLGIGLIRFNDLEIDSLPRS